MSKLDELIQELCPDGVEYVPIGSLIEKVTDKGKIDRFINQVYVVSNTKGIVKAEEYRDNAVHSEDTSNYTIVKPGMFAYNPSRLNIGSIAMLKEETAGLVSPMYIVFKIKENIIKKQYFEYVIKWPYVINKINSFKEEGARFRFDFSRWNWILIPLPPLDIQEEIVRILDDFMLYQNELAAELAARKKQYEYYRDNLLEFDDSVPKMTLGEIATEMYRGAGIKRDEVTEEGIPCIRYGEIYTDYEISFTECISHTSDDVVANPKFFEYGDIIFTITGESVEEIAKSVVYLGHERCMAGGDTVVMKHNQEPRFLSYVLSTTSAQEQKSKGKVKSKVVHSSVPALKEIVIPIPDLETQKRIADILDNFRILINDISTGLPAEIEARQKQYEYYRDKLLTFKEKEA